MLLAILAFSLSLLGTFLVRSGVLTSVHAFATDPARGVFILLFLAIVVGGSLTLFAWRAGKVGLGGRVRASCRANRCCSRTTSCWSWRWRACCSARCIRCSSTRSNLGKMSVGPPYFDAVFYPLMAPAAFLMGIGPMATLEQGARCPSCGQRLRWALAVAIVSALMLPMILGHWTPLIAGGVFLAVWIVASAAQTLRVRIASAPRGDLLGALRANSSSYYGMLLAHVGVGVFIAGVTLVKGYEIERDLRMEPANRSEVGGYDFRFVGVTPGPGPNYRAVTGTFEVRKDARLVETLKPEKRIYNASGQTMTIAAIDVGVLGDRYVSLGEPAGAPQATSPARGAFAST